MTAISARPECPHCSASIESDDHCWRCGLPPFTEVVGIGPEPDYKEQPINQRCAPCRGCGERFIEWAPGVTGDTVRVYRDEDNRWVRYHEHCWPWGTS